MNARYLHPGGYLFGHCPYRVQTLLGSCVALCAWHPERHLLLVSHAMFPNAPNASHGFDGRYADQVLRRLRGDLQASGSAVGDFRFLLAGGASQHGSGAPEDSVGARILDVLRAGIRELGIEAVHAEHCGGRVYRKLLINGRDGSCRILPLQTSAAHARATR